MLFFLSCVLLFSLCCGADPDLSKDDVQRRVSPSHLLRPSLAVENRQGRIHVFDFAGQEFVDSSYKEPWLHLIQMSLKPDIEVLMDTDFTLSFNYTVVCTNKQRAFEVHFRTTDGDVLSVKDSDEVTITCENSTRDSLYNIVPTVAASSTYTLVSATPSSPEQPPVSNFYVDGVFNVNFSSGILGKVFVEFVLEEINNTSAAGNGDGINGALEIHREIVKYPVKVLRKIRPIDRLFRVIIYSVQVLVMVGFGIKLDLQIVKEHLWKPVAPVMGLCCQYLLMPTIAFAVAKSVDIETQIVALGIFIAGCCPGGGGSNMYSYLLKGNLSLSITMTAISTVAALGMLPLWVYTLGYTFLEDQDLVIPFSMVAVSLSILITPLVIGVFLRQKLRRVAKTIQKLLKPTILVMSFLLIIVGVYSNLFIFRLFKPRTVLAACLLPYIGYISGGIIALVFQQPWKTVKTISIETGMQNTSIAYILMTSSFPAPEGDIGSVAPVASAIMTPIPVFIITLIYTAYQKLKKKYKAVEQTEDTDKSNEDTHELEDAEDTVKA